MVSMSTQTVAPTADMEILESYECGKRIDGVFQAYVKVIVLHDGAYYIGKWKDRRQLPREFSQLEDAKIIHTENRGPELRAHWLQASPDSGRWLKTPAMEDYLDSDLEARMAHEIEMCEFIRQHHHRNLAEYLGCCASQGRATGLLFKRYKATLLERVNPQRLSKEAFIASGRPLVTEYMKDWVSSLRAALHHLHHLGLVHNDITPANIMLDESDVPIIIDFDGLCRTGESLQHTKRTMGWHDETVVHAAQLNDTDAIAELETWLFGRVENLKFA
ncbi:hypothetical protein NQ176_g5446 [Zarea fungicola]|uniref:Uncharacterized protein n=1 Tax=Zarea fungicola TaxID=93591 RepID=A0ACC1N9D4_9HYPO|nr:hypothetical protein NQ176_g5446 [Lecanicillium fungicola]